MSAEGLTKMDELFIDEYFNNNFNATAAYKIVFKVDVTKKGYYNATRLLRQTYIKNEIEKRWDEIRETNMIRRDEIIIHLKNVMYESIMNKDNNTLLKVIDMLNKMAGNYTLQIEANVNQIITLNIPGLELPDENDDEQ